MLLEQNPDGTGAARVGAACCCDGIAPDLYLGWELVQRDWGARQGEPAQPWWGWLTRLLARPLTAVTTLARGARQ